MKVRRDRQSGLTLIELLIVVAIIGIVASMATLSGAETKHRLAVKTLSDEIKSKLVQARMNAVTHGVRVTFCPVEDVVTVTKETACSTDWSRYATASQANGVRGWIVFKDNNANGKVDHLDNIIDKLQFDQSNGPAVVDISETALTFPSGMGNLVRFSRKGNLARLGTVTIPIKSESYPFRYEVVINASGSISHVDKASQ